jgi:hypothetical protein
MNPYPKPAEGMEINQVEDGYVIYPADRDRVHYLNHTAVPVLEGRTGSTRGNLWVPQRNPSWCRH